MANLKEIRVRIASVKSTQQITKAMHMVSASKLRRAQDAILVMRPFAEKLKEILQNVSGTLDASTGGAYAVVRPVKKVLIIAITSNRGLCGGFNANIIRAVNTLIRENYSTQAADGNVKIMCIGKKASDFFSKNKKLFLESHNDVFTKLAFDDMAPIAEKIMAEFAAGNYDKVEVVYNRFKNAVTQIVTREQVLPIVAPEKKEGSKSINDYIFEPDKEQIVMDLIPKSIKIQLYKAALDSNASEHGARMSAMSKATDNAGELLISLRLFYNKARQAAITGEILEIVGGAEALKG
jgi:F-type H+-transporting ATPase subunit gamma